MRVEGATVIGLAQTADGPVVRHDLPTPRGGDEAVIRLAVGGVCATDLEIAQGYMGFEGVMGHEWVGVVESAPDAAWVGARVVGDINCPCGRCDTCAAARPTHCPDRTVLGIAGRDGAFSERFRLPVANLHRVPDGVSDDAAVFVEPLAAACEIMEQVHTRPSDRVAVVGIGRLGQLCARVLALSGAGVTAVSRNPARFGLLPPGIDHATPDQARSLRPFDLVVDATGSAQGLAAAAKLLRPRGTLVLKTTVHDPVAVTPTPWVIDEITVIGSRCGPFAPALRLLESGAVDPRALISARYPLSDGVAALTAAASRDHVKVLLTP